MKSVSIWITGALIFLLAATAGAQSLGDLAKKEKERRQAIKTDAKVITNNNANRTEGAVSTTPPAEDTEKPSPEAKGKAVEGALGENSVAEGEQPLAEGDKNVADNTGAAGGKKDAEEPVDFQGRPESYWKQVFAEARKKVSDLENEANVLVLKLNDLHNRFYREDSGFKQQAIQRDIQKTYYEQDANKAELEKARGDLIDLEREARKSGALPGWIRAKS
jgi:hypothetical protein